MQKINNKIIVWSIDDFNTLGLMRELGGKELNVVFLIFGKKGIASSSKYCSTYLETESIEEGFNYLKNNFLNEPNKPILIVSSDAIITFLDEHSKELNDRYVLPLCSLQGNTKKYTNKVEMTKLAEELGILCPKSKEIKKGDNLDFVEYPCLIKPSHERPGHYNEFKFKICKNPKQLKKVMKYVNGESDFILQQYVQKENDALIYGGRMRDGTILYAGALIRDRFSFDSSTSHGLITPHIPKSIDLKKLDCFLEQIDYYGLFSFEFGMTKDKAYFFEVNLRNDGTSDYFNQAGANIPLAYVMSCAGLNYDHIQTLVENDSWFIDEVCDYENVITKSITKKQWKDDKDKATVFKYYNKEDLTPWKIVNKRKYKTFLREYILKKYRIYIVFFLDKIGLRK